ncbi:MAG TPA: acyl-CoA reductase, partial [Candidatus Wallbacteria bacterium]|nr:acyl-CoA reductase [Candidatus Wallbacteria bacterium]
MKRWFRFGDIREDENITPEMIAKVIEDGRKIAGDLKNIPLIKILGVLERTSDILSDRNHPIRIETLDKMPAIIGFSRPMVENGLDTLCATMRMPALLARLDTDLEDSRFLDEFTYHKVFDGYIKAEPRGIVAHVSAGNVFIGAVDTLLQGIMTKNVNILKMSSIDTVFPILFAKAMLEADPAGIVAKTFCLVPFRSGDEGIEKLIKSECNVVIVYGGKEAIEAYRRGLGEHTRIVEYGPKYSCAILDGKLMSQNGVAETARLMAHDFTMWEQSACSSPHTVFVKGEKEAYEFSRNLALELENYSKIYPHGKIPVNEQVEITKSRELARAYQAAGEAELTLPAGGSQEWTIIYEKKADFRVSCHHRTAYVKPVPDFDSAVKVLAPYGEFIQSVAVLATSADLFDVSEKLCAIGADRITEPGNMSRRKNGTPHDGTRGTAEFVRWVSIGKKAVLDDQFDYMPRNLRDELTLERLNYLLSYCRERSDFYRERLPRTPLRSLKELSRIPILSQKDFRDHLPPTGTGILTAPLGKSYSFGSGGTVGNPKFIFRTVKETRRNTREMAKGLVNSGLAETDIVANLFFAGNMWASFVSVNMALEEAGCHILPIAGNVCDMEAIISYIKAFSANVIISIPSVIISLAQYVEKNKSGVKIEKVFYGGEHFFPDAQKYVAETLGAKIIASAGYATNDTGMAAMQCSRCEGGVHHISENLHIVEIVDPETNEPVEDGREGKIILTNIDRFLMPIIRYDIGDMGKIVNGQCECGKTLKLMELLGRSDEVLIIGGGNISQDAVARAISKVEGLSFQFRMTARLLEMHDQFVLEVETNSKVSEETARELEDKMYASLLAEKQEFVSFLKTQSIARP